MTRLDWTPTHLDALRAQAWATWISWGESQRRALTREYHEATATGLARPESIPVAPDAYFAPGKRPTVRRQANRAPMPNYVPRETAEERYARVSAAWAQWVSSPAPATHEPLRPTKARRCHHGGWDCPVCKWHAGFPMEDWEGR